MKIIENQTAEIWNQNSGIQGVYEQIERAARVCYQSQDLIKAGSAEKIVNALIKSNHTAMLEHGTIYLERTLKDPSEYKTKEQYLRAEKEFNEFVNRYADDKFSDVMINQYHNYVAITTNYRVIIENKFEQDLKYMCSLTKFHKKRITVCMITNIQVATEYIRHRMMSFAMESTRYCSYDKEKFGNEITFILPGWLNTPKTTKTEVIEWVNAMQDAENHYMRLRDIGWKPQQCAQVLPKATKTTLIMTGTIEYWDSFFNLRYFEKTGPAHPQAKELATIIYNLIYQQTNDQYKMVLYVVNRVSNMHRNIFR